MQVKIVHSMCPISPAFGEWFVAFPAFKFIIRINLLETFQMSLENAVLAKGKYCLVEN